MSNAIEILTRFEIRPSHQRVAIMDYLLTHKTHATADVIFDALSKEMPVLSRTTVYNTLRLFAEKGAIKALILEQDALHFDADLEPHAHFFCSRCKKIYDVVLPDEIWKLIEDNASYGTMTTQLNYSGICKKCNN